MGLPLHLDERGVGLLERRNQHWRATLHLRRDPFLYREGQLFARDVTGFVNLGSASVEIAPKFLSTTSRREPQWRESLWAILSRVYRVPGYLLNTPALLTNVDSLPDLLGLILISSLRDNRPNGRPMGYRTERGRLSHFQGRLDIANALDLVTHPGQIPCEYDAYTENVPANRLLRWSAEQLSRQVQSVQLSFELREEAMAFESISPSPPATAEADRIVLPPHHGVLQPAIAIGQLLLQGRGMQHGYGPGELPGFLWKSDDVFERFVIYLLQIVIRTYFPKVGIARGALQLSEAPPVSHSSLRTIPDIRLVDRHGTLGVLDAKYKTMMRNQPHRDDVYQVITGAWVTESPAAVLIFPSPDGSHEELRKWHLMGPNPPARLWTLFVNLVAMGSREGERILVDQLKTDLETILMADPEVSP